MIYRLPKLEDEKILNEYIKEHYEIGENELHGSCRLEKIKYDEWVQKIESNTKVSDEKWGKSVTYLVFNDENILVGLLNIRYELRDEMRNKYGDIGYGVRPSERKKGYATKMLNYALKECKERNMKNVILGCYENNIASSKTIIKNGGILVKKSKLDGQNCLYYEIKLV